MTGPIAESSRAAYQKVLTGSGYGTITTEILPSEGRVFYPAEGHHQQYLDRNPAGYRGIGGTGVKIGDPFETNRGSSCPTGVVPAPGH